MAEGTTLVIWEGTALRKKQKEEVKTWEWPRLTRNGNDIYGEQGIGATSGKGCSWGIRK